MVENVHYKKDGDKVVFTALYHLERGYCCGNGCKHCPFDPIHTKGVTNVQDKYLETQEDILTFKYIKGYENRKVQ